MSRKLLCLLAALLLVGTAFAPAAVAQTTVGYISVDTSSPGDIEFDITGYTGSESFLNPDSNPITTAVTLSDLSLSVGSSTFTLDADGVSYQGTPELASILTGVDTATLTGQFDETVVTLADSTTETIEADFTAVITDSTGLVDGDYAYILATPASSGPPPPIVPEPEPFLMVGTGLMGLIGMRRRFFMASIRKFSSSLAGLAIVLAFAGFFLLAPVSAQAQAKLAAWTVPSTGLAGYNDVTDTAAGIPSGATAGATTVTFAASCGGAPVATESPISLTKVGPNTRAEFAIPGSLTSGNYFVTLSSSAPSFTSSNCSEITVTATTTTLAACVPTSSLAVVSGANVNAFVPNGSWCCSGGTNIQEVPLEGSGPYATFATGGDVNSCAANSSTGEVVCVENGGNVDLIPASATSVITILSGATGYAGFSGGSCEDCGVGVNAGNNTAVIEEGISGSPSNSGVQVLNLASNTFNAPFAMQYEVSEDISIDSGRNLILSPSESGWYELLKIGAGNSLTEYSNYISPDGEPDSAAEDCTTGIALASDEFANDIYITDLSQATFGASTWTAPGQFFNLDDGGTYEGFSAGTCGISSAPGTNHLAVVTGEFGGSSFAALKLPSTSGSGTPTLADWAYAYTMPDSPDGGGFSAGYDPHTVTAYTSPNTNKSYAVFADYEYSDSPAWLGVVDLACTLALPRDPGTNNITNPATALIPCVNYVSVLPPA
jgi:hypothetical protein